MKKVEVEEEKKKGELLGAGYQVLGEEETW